MGSADQMAVGDGPFTAIASVPEPSSLALLAAAIGLFAVPPHPVAPPNRKIHQSADRRLDPPPSIVTIEPVV
jgi:hypothetical protein